MAGKPFIVDPATIDLNHVVADINEIRRCNQQRYEMEMLTAVVHIDAEACLIVGYKDVGESEFWVRGHMPTRPLMPGVLMCEVAAQLCSFAAHKLDLLGPGVVGFGGLDAVRFRGPVLPGDRLVMACRREKARRGRMLVCEFQGWVEQEIVCEGRVIGVLLPMDQIPVRT